MSQDKEGQWGRAMGPCRILSRLLEPMGTSEHSSTLACVGY